MSQDPFDHGAGSSGANITDFEGDLLYIVPTEHLTGDNAVKTADFGAKDVIVANIYVLDGDNAGTYEEGVYIFQGRVIQRLRQTLRKQKPFVGRLGKGKEKVKGNFPWELSTELTAKDKKLATDHMEKLRSEQESEDPFDN